MAGYYGPDYHSQRRPRDPYHGASGPAPSAYAPSSYGGKPYARDAREVSDDSSYYEDDITDDSFSDNFQRLSMSARPNPANRGPRYHTQPQPQPQPRGLHRPPSPSESSYSQSTTARAQAYQAQAYDRRVPSKSLDRLSHYLGKGYRLAGPYTGDEDSVDSDYRSEERSRGVMIPAQNPRPRSVRRSSSGGGPTMERGHRVPRATSRRYPVERPNFPHRSSSAGAHERFPRGPQSEYGGHHPRAPGMIRRSSSISRFDSISQIGKAETAPAPSGALVRRSKSVGPVRDGWASRRKSLGNVNASVVPNPNNPGGTAVRLDLGGREVDIAVNDHNASKRRGPAIGSITINQNGPPKDGPAPSEAGKARDTFSQRGWDERTQRFLGELNSPPSSPSDDEFERMQKKFNNVRQRTRSASLGTTLPRRKVPLQIGAPPSANGPPAPPPGGELRHTRISRKIVTRQALEELGYVYEDTGDTFTVFQILRPEEIDELMDMTARIRGRLNKRSLLILFSQRGRNFLTVSSF